MTNNLYFDLETAIEDDVNCVTHYSEQQNKKNNKETKKNLPSFSFVKGIRNQEPCPKPVQGSGNWHYFFLLRAGL